MRKLRIFRNGLSFSQILKRLMFLSVLVCFVFYVVHKNLHPYYVAQTIEKVQNFFVRYNERLSDFVDNNASFKNLEQLQSFHLMPDCKTKTSAFNQNVEVCALPLGEIDASFQSTDDRLYAFVYVHFTDIYKENSCRQFLSNDWERKMAKIWFGEEGYIGVVSENTQGKIYFSLNRKWIREDGAERNPTEDHLRQVCKVCRKSRYCTIIFAFDVDKQEYRAIKRNAQKQ